MRIEIPVMHARVRLSAVFALVSVLGVGACRKTVTDPIYRRPVISSVVAFPTTLGVGDSTMITINATDPNGDPLVYGWDAYNGLVARNVGFDSTHIFPSRSASIVLYRSPSWPSTIDTAFVWCTVSDQKGGIDQRQLLIFYKN
jgi:hypothetical protein